MTLILAAVHASATIVVADRAREVGGYSKATRDNNAQKLVLSASGDIVVALAGDVILGTTGAPEHEVATWMSSLEAASPTDRAECLRLRAQTHCGRPSDGRRGLLLLFDRDDPGRVSTVTVSANALSGVDASLIKCDLRQDQPSVWGLEQSWSSLSSESWDSTRSPGEIATALRDAIASYASAHAGAVVSRATCEVTI